MFRQLFLIYFGLLNSYQRLQAESILQSISGDTKQTNLTFKDFIGKFKPSRVWKEIEENNIRNGINKTFKEEYIKILNKIDETDELLNLTVQNGEPVMLLRKDGRRWKPPGDIYQEKIMRHDPFSLRGRIFELMKQAIYQARMKMVIMQAMREKYSKISVYKMGFLISKTDTMCKTFAKMAWQALYACGYRYAGYTYMITRDMLEIQERLLDLWFEIELLVDLIKLNDQNCKRMLNQAMTNRKHAWKFVD